MTLTPPFHFENPSNPLIFLHTLKQDWRRVYLERGSCIQKYSQGRGCYVPGPRFSTDVTYIGRHARDSSMTVFMAVHLKKGLSVTYYLA